MREVHLVSATDFHNFFLEFPEEKWIVGSYEDQMDFSLHCALGFLGAREAAPHNDNIHRFARLHHLFAKKTGQSIIVSEVNDGKDKNYQQDTPRQRVLEMCADLIAHGL